jgi:uncharacterized Zn-binding protein involved in type VI secretion
MGKAVACVGDTSTHEGEITTSGQDGSLTVGGAVAAVAGARHKCDRKNHGTTDITPVTVRSYHNGKLIITQGAIAGCGAVITPTARGVSVE